MRRLLIIVAIVCLSVSTGAIAKSKNLYGPTKSNDRLWRIALAVKSNRSIIPQQTMLAILRKNPRAFSYHNVNGLRAGYCLHMPSKAEIKRTSPHRAIQQVHQQNKHWQQIKNKGIRDLTPLSHGLTGGSKNVGNNKKTGFPACAGNDSKLMGNDSKLMGNGSNQQKKDQKTAIIGLTVLQMENQRVLMGLNQKLYNTNKIILDLNQQYQMRLANLERRNLLLQTHVRKINKQLRSLQKDVNLSQLQQQKATYEYLLVICLAGLVLILLLILLGHIWYWHKRCKPKTIEPETDYDFMGSKESIPAKLDLARAYIDMADKKSARKVLKEIIAQGNAKQRKEAEKLLTQIK